MSWRWRKSINNGPFRTIISKKGIGWSVGGRGLRFGVSPDGRRYISIGLFYEMKRECHKSASVLVFGRL